MKFNILNICGIFMIPILFAACEKEVKLKEDEITPRIVVNSIFEAEDTLRINLSESRNILFNNGGVLPNLTDANAKLLNSAGNEIGKFVHEGDGIYYLPNFVPKTGQLYKLEVSNDGFADITAENIIPNALAISSVDTSSQVDRMNFDVKFKDNPNEKNYYAMSITAKVSYTYEVEPGVFVTDVFEDRWICSKDINIEGSSADIDGEICNEELLFNDELFNGTDYTFSCSKYMGGDIDTLVVTLRSISEDLYKYKISYQKYLETNGNPFGEPVQVFSNVENGFGIFAGSSIYSEIIEVE